MKTCTKCKTDKSNELFSKCASRADGLQSACKDCKKKQLDTWRKANPKKWNAYKDKWYLGNKSKSAEYQRRRRANILGNGFTVYSEIDVLKKYGTSCHLCNLSIDLTANRRAGKPGWENGLHIDHVIPLSKGGPDTLENVRPSHGICNIARSNTAIA